jgi:fimbrial chaperone protein
LRLSKVLILAAFGCLPVLSDAEAASISVSPTLIDQAAPVNTAAVRLRTPGKEPVRIQVRVFRWTQIDGKDHLEPTRDVVASPPMLKVAPGADYTVRVVRTVKQPAGGEESYRLLVDQLPEPKDRRANRVNLVIRQSIPVFFRNGEEQAPAISWTVAKTKRGAVLTARNDGDRRLKLTDLTVKTASGNVLRRIDGLAGYVLGRATMSWPIVGSSAELKAGSRVDIEGSGESGPIHATGLVKAFP